MSPHDAMNMMPKRYEYVVLEKNCPYQLSIITLTLDFFKILQPALLVYSYITINTQVLFENGARLLVALPRIKTR